MKKIAILVSVLLPCLFALSCNKEKGKEENKPAELSVVLSDVKDVYEVPKNQSISVNLMVVPDPVSAEAYTISLAANPGLVATYNAAKGTDYQMLPSSAFSIAGTSVMLTRYSAKSTACELRLKGEGCDTAKVYLLPISIDGVQGGTNFTAPDEKAAYILFKMTPAQQLGSGTEADPYLIDGMEAFEKVNSLLKEDETVYFKMTVDLDLKDVVYTDKEGDNPWTPINSGDAEAAAKRAVVFNGDGHKISNFKADKPLFATLIGRVENLVIENAEIEAAGKDGAILAGVAGSAETASDIVVKNVTIKNSKLTSDYMRVGALIGWLKGGIVENVESDAPVTGASRAGGLIGLMENGQVINCSSTGNVKGDSYYLGGLIGYIADASGSTEIPTVTVKGCHATGDVANDSGNYVRAGGLIGQTECNLVLEKCYATGNITGSGHYGGGLLGVLGKEGITVSISKCYATGTVTLPTGGNWAHAGGLVGSIASKNTTLNISDCYATGKIVCERYSSGFLGSIYSAADSKLTITNSYTTSDVSGVNRLFGIALGANATATISCKGFIAWSASSDTIPFCNPADAIPTDGNYYGHEGALSSHATALSWSTEVWDLTGDLPKLK